MKRGLRRLSFEFFSIVVAVVLAMALTEWRQSYLNKRQAESSFRNILLEVQENMNELKLDSVKVASDIQFMNRWLNAKKEGEKAEDFGVNFSYSFLSTAALEVARINQSLTHLHNEKIMDMAEIYASQQFYTENAAKVFDIMGELVGRAKETDDEKFIDGVRKFRFHLNLVFNTIKAYIQEADKLLAKYSEEYDLVNPSVLINQ